uniref:ChaJ1 n=1 Tax=Streptomyces chattanoogensis TaxID=66876 RepID=A0A0A0R6S2_9ACTN|nr:ChaJ1 [Streptomyces chattanoogensis]
MAQASASSSPSAPATHAGQGPVRWRPGQWLLLSVLAGNMLIDALEVSVVLVTLPTIGHAFHLSTWATQWVMGGFALGFGAALIPGARLTTALGRRPVYLAALLAFTAASLVGGLATDPVVLTVTRVVKGVCAALTAPTGLAIITTTFREGPERSRAISVYSFFGAIGFTAGLLLSGLLTPAGWRWVFLFPAPVALLLLLLGVRYIPRDGRRVPSPAVPLRRLLRNGRLMRSALGAAVLNGTFLGLLFIFTFRLQTVRGWTPWQTALAFLPACVPLAVSALRSGPLVRRFGTPRLIALGAAAACAGDALALRTAALDAPYPTGLLPVTALVGAGFVFAFVALNTQAGGSVPAEQRGTAIALYQTAVQFGAVLMLGSVSALLAAGHPGRAVGADALAAAYRPPLLLVAAVAAAGLLIALGGLVAAGSRRRAPR